MEALNPAERRMVSLLGKARGGSHPSQHLQLFDWLCRTGGKGELPANLVPQLPTLVLRLKALMLEAMRLLDKDPQGEGRLMADLHAALLLMRKRLHGPAERLLRRVVTEAGDACRWDLSLRGCGLLRSLILDGAGGQLTHQLAALEREESQALEALRVLQALRQANDRLIAVSARTQTGRNSTFDGEMERIRKRMPLEALWQDGNWLEQSIAGHLLCIMDLFSQRPVKALDRYSIILPGWAAHPGRQLLEPRLFLSLCRNYQNACFLVPMSTEDLLARLNDIPQPAHLDPHTIWEAEYSLLSARLVHVLQSCNFALLPALRPAVMEWVTRAGGRFLPSKLLALLYNTLVADFLGGNLSECNRTLLLVHRLELKGVREDIQHFLRVFQAILHFEMDNMELNEYIIRSARRHFSRHSFGDSFELSVLECLTIQVREPGPARRKQAWLQLEGQLMVIRERLPSTQLMVGLMETLLWVRSKLSARSLATEYTLEVDRVSGSGT